MDNYNISNQSGKVLSREEAKKYRKEQNIKLNEELCAKKKDEISVSLYADLLKMRIERNYERVGGGKRSVCKGFSVNSRRRMIKKTAMWDLRGLFLAFLTLTYPRVYTSDWRIWKRDLDVFWKWLERKYPEVMESLWHVEEQKRGAPHFHLLIGMEESLCTCGSEQVRRVKGKIKQFHKPYCRIHQIRREIGQKWAEIVQDGYRMSGGDMQQYEQEYEKHKKAGTNVEAVYNRKHLMQYVSKYMAKVPACEGCGSRKTVGDVCQDCGVCKDLEDMREWGRMWGFRALNGELKFDPIETENLEYSELVNLKRMVRKWMKSRGSAKYAKKVKLMPSYSVLGLGIESVNNGLGHRMVESAKAGLLASHISPAAGSGEGTQYGRGPPGGLSPPGELRFIDRVALGLVGTGKGVKEGDRVQTPRGLGVVSGIYQCPILKRLRCVIVLDEVQPDGSHFGPFDIWQVQPC
ncbi:MAG TPA: hypothetical protein VGE97_02690 [Nitrososphaera sp.]